MKAHMALKALARRCIVVSRKARFTVALQRMAGLAMYSFILPAMLLLSGCRIQPDEVARTVSPSGAVDAVVLEVSGGATTSYLYEVCLVPHDGDCKDADTVVSIYGATRNKVAYGVNLRWVDSLHLNVEYASAKRVPLHRSSTIVAGATVLVSLKAGVVDPTAPAGGMHYNMH